MTELITPTSALASPPQRAPAPLRDPQSTGEIITAAVRTLRAHLGVIVAVSLPLCAVNLVVREVGNTLAFGLAGDAAALDLGAIAAMAPKLLAALGFFLTSFWLNEVLAGAVCIVAVDSFQRRAPTVSSTLRRLLDRAVPLLLTATVFVVAGSVLVVLAIGLPIVAGGAIALASNSDPTLLIIGGVVLGLVLGLVAFVVLTLRYSLYAPIVVTEHGGPFAFLRRSQALTAGRGLPFVDTPRFRFSVLLLIALAITSVLQGLFVGPRIIAALLTGWRLGDALPGLSSLPLWFAVPFGLVEVVTNAIVVPLAALLTAFFVFDLRVRYEPDTVDAIDVA